MAKSKYPYKAFTVSPAMIIKEVTIVAPGTSWRARMFEQTEAGATVHKDNLLASRDAAIQMAKKTLAVQEARLKKSQSNFEKRRANLAKAEAA